MGSVMISLLTEVPTIRGKLINLRELRPADAASVSRHANDREVSRWMPKVPFPYRIEDAHGIIRVVRERAKAREGYYFGIEYPETGEIVGVIGLKEVHWDDRWTEIGYWLGRRYWRRGFTEEAVRLALGFAYKEVRLHRVSAAVLEPNHASAALLEKIGFRYEGTWQQVWRVGRDWYDAHWYGLLRREFRAVAARRTR